MITVIIDTNALATGFVRANPDAAPARLIDAWRARRFALALSEHTLTELERTFSRPYSRERLPRDEVAADLALLRQRARIVPLTVSVEGVATHPADDLVLATALSARADYLMTGDSKLQAFGSYRGARVVSLRQVVDILTAQAPDSDPPAPA